MPAVCASRYGLLALAVLAACGGSGGSSDAPTIAFDLEHPLAGSAYWDFPQPSDLRLTADGKPDLSGFPNPRTLPIVDDLLSAASDRKGWPVMPIAYFRFTDPTTVPALSLDKVIAPGADASAVLVDVDDLSPEKGTSYALVGHTLVVDDYASPGLIALAPRPGIVLRAHTKYAFVLKTSFAPGVEPPAAMADLYADEWPALEAVGIAEDDVLAATFFTTGDEVETLATRSEGIRKSATATIANIHAVAGHDGFCDVAADVTFPQYQTGTQPFFTDGRLVLDANGVPVKQGEMTVPLHITLPTGVMPADGWPLWQFFHGSGGASTDIVDNGRSPTSDDIPTPGQGPGFVVARRGIATASSALPVNPERLPGAQEFAYLNFSNLSAFPATFQQGVFEQRLLLDALLALEIPQDALTACGAAAPTLSTDAGVHHFNAQKLVAGGHSMGGMYTNMIAAIEPRYGALTPFGAGGFWNLMILDTVIVPGARDVLGGILGVEGAELTFTHPVLGLLGLGWEIADPINSMARIVRRPLAGIPPRHVYEPIGLDDKFFPNNVYDATALAYGNQQAGDLVWPETQDALAVDHLDGILPYAVTDNRAASSTTSVVVQYADDGIVDSHQIFRQLPAVKYQYACFLDTFLRDGVPVVAAPQAEDAPCPE